MTVIVSAVPLRMTGSVSIHVISTVFRYYFHFVERRSVGINGNPPRPVRTCDEYLPLPLLFFETEEICLIVHLKVQQFFISRKKSATDFHGY